MTSRATKPKSGKIGAGSDAPRAESYLAREAAAARGISAVHKDCRKRRRYLRESVNGYVGGIPTCKKDEAYET